MRIVFLGSADFGVPALQMLLRKHEVVGIVSTPPRQKGRGLKIFNSPIVEFAQYVSVAPVFMPETFNDQTLIDQLRALAADCFVVVAFKILPRSIFSIPPFGTLNIHASLLPAFRGPAPIQRAIEAGEKKTGVTVFRIDEGIDTGDILVQQEMVIGDEMSTPELYEQLSVLGAAALDVTLDSLHNGTVKSITQHTIKGSKAPKLTKAEACINWIHPAITIFNRIRAFKPFPGTFTRLHGKRLEIEWAHPIATPAVPTKPGTICNISKDHFDVQTGDGLLRILMVKPEGRKTMLTREFLLGTVLRDGDQFHE